MKDLKRYSNWDLVNNFVMIVWQNVFSTSITDRMFAETWLKSNSDAEFYIGEIYSRTKSDKAIKKCEDFVKHFWGYGKKRLVATRWKPDQWQPIDSEIEKFKMSILSIFPKPKEDEE